MSRSVTQERIDRVLATPYEQLDTKDKRLYTIIKKHGSYEASLKAMASDKILAGINGGRHRGRKGFGTWEKGKLSSFVATRERDSKGRFIPHTSQEAAGEAWQQSSNEVPEDQET